MYNQGYSITLDTRKSMKRGIQYLNMIVQTTAVLVVFSQGKIAN